MKDLYYSVDEKILFWITPESNETNLVSYLNNIVFTGAKFSELLPKSEVDYSIQVTHTATYKNRLILFVVTEIKPDNAVCLYGDNMFNKWINT